MQNYTDIASQACLVASVGARGESELSSIDALPRISATMMPVPDAVPSRGVAPADPAAKVPLRHGIHYWKCDRPAAFHGTAQGGARSPRPDMTNLLADLVTRHIGSPPTSVDDAGTQGDHLTFVAVAGGQRVFIRVEDGPEQDDYMDAACCVMERVRVLGVPTPRVLASDASRSEMPFAWQILEHVADRDLNRHLKDGTLATAAVARQIGRLIATWQALPVTGFGPFDVPSARHDGSLVGLHGQYADYFRMRLDAHLRFLVQRSFLPAARADAIAAAIDANQGLLDLHSGCLVHKDMALWNLLGPPARITAVIDWDDCVAGDPLDDLSLLGCFHDGAFLRAAFDGYASVRDLPPDHSARFWLHLLRNMLFKAVIRVGAGYFDHDSSFFLIGAGGDGASLRARTLERIESALAGLCDGRDPFGLG
jgi:aminoglycoside phosphotransferase (APT) family kinase protein